MERSVQKVNQSLFFNNNTHSLLMQVTTHSLIIRNDEFSMVPRSSSVSSETDRKTDALVVQTAFTSAGKVHVLIQMAHLILFYAFMVVVK